MKKLLLIIIFICAFTVINAQNKYSLYGTVRDINGQPISGATIYIQKWNVWSVSSENGEFRIEKVPAGESEVSISCLGFKNETIKLTIDKNIKALTVCLKEDNLLLETAQVTAEDNRNSIRTSRVINRTALDHLQIVNVSDISSLLPGGSTANIDLTIDNTKGKFQIRTANEALSTSFGTAVEIDGVRLSSNGDFSDATGASTRNLASSNIESVEVIAGVPSVEYGDLNSGLVKISTQKGKTPYSITMTTNPSLKSVSISKGFGLKNNWGIINISGERTKAIRSIMSPYTSYSRNNLSINYSNTFNLNGGTTPLKVNANITGNIGGYNSKSDPDSYKDTYSKARDNAVRANVLAEFLFNSDWITSLELKCSVNYCDKYSETRTNVSSSSNVIALHGKDEGYFIATLFDDNPEAAVIQIPNGYWFQTSFNDSRPLSYASQIKAVLSKGMGDIISSTSLGFQFSGSGNIGKGTGYKDLRYAKTWREWRYDLVPFYNNAALFLEEQLSVPIGSTHIRIVAGGRIESSFMKDSEYNPRLSFSPRLNVKWSIIDSKGKTLSKLSVRGSWGMAKKQPSLNMLYPTPTYEDYRTFAPAALSDGSTFSVYYILPKTMLINQNLKFQTDNQSEIGLDMTLAGIDISLAAFYDLTVNSYFTDHIYKPFSYLSSTQKDIENTGIPQNNIIFSVDSKTGLITATDKTNIDSGQILGHTIMRRFTSSPIIRNSISPVRRMGLEWVIIFPMIRPVLTDIKIDGTLYSYNYLNENELYSTSTTYYHKDGQPYKYVGCYAGGAIETNGENKSHVKCNLTLTTHIPKVRTIISLRVETMLLNISQPLSRSSNGTRSWEVASANSLVAVQPIELNSGKYAVTYPSYYYAIDDPDTHIPFKDKYEWARENDSELYKDLTEMVIRSSYAYTYTKNKITPYWSANFSITKEIGKTASISIFANNFLNNLASVKSFRSGTSENLFNNYFIPGIYWGGTLRLKF